MNILIVNDYDEMSKKAAHIFVAQILRSPESVLGLATGSTPVGLYEALIRFYNEGMISFEGVVTFNLDEYVGLEAHHPQSYSYFMNEHLFKHVDIQSGNYHIPSGAAADIERECNRYEAMILNAGGIDLQVLGIGRNGHIGFNEPDIKFEARTHVVNLDDQTITDNARFFNSTIDVPKMAISMGIKTIMQSRGIVLLASGREKAEALAGMVSGKITPEIPASVLQLHPNVTIIVDREAATMLDIENLKSEHHINLNKNNLSY